MIERYRNTEIAKIWTDRHKLEYWQDTELAVIQAMVNLGRIRQEIFDEISRILNEELINIDWWKIKDKEIRHDLNAFLEERLRFLPLDLQLYFHRKMTSYDTEEPPFARMLKESLGVVRDYYLGLETALKEMALKYRHTIMMGITHGQWAELQTFGKRCLTWLKVLRVDWDNLQGTAEKLKYSKLSGAIGNYGGIDPDLEKEALKILGFEPFYGATQIMPREIYTPVACALCQIVLTFHKIATDIRLGARSGRPIYQEPFSKKQKGSSAMPHKKNTISTEQIEGMARMAKGYFSMIQENIKTWEERAIEQSCVERVAWPDLFHVVAHSLKTLKRVLKGLRVYPDNMLLDVIESRGCYASNEAKEVLKKLGMPLGLSTEDAYRIVQLAAFCVFEVGEQAKELRENPSKSLTEADELLTEFKQIQRPIPVSIQEVIAESRLETSDQLAATEENVQRWNEILRQIFQNPENIRRWDQIFQPSYLLRNEAKLYQEILGV